MTTIIMRIVTRAVLIIEAVVAGFQFLELPQSLILLTIVAVAGTMVTTLVITNTRKKYALQYDEVDHTHEDPHTTVAQKSANCAICNKDSQTRYF